MDVPSPHACTNMYMCVHVVNMHVLTCVCVLLTCACSWDVLWVHVVHMHACTNMYNVVHIHVWSRYLVDSVQDTK